MRKYGQRNRFPFTNQCLNSATRLSARRFEIFISENPQLRGFDRTKRGHRVIPKWRPEDEVLAFLTNLGRGVRQNEMRVITMQILIPRLMAVLGSHSIEILEAFRETTLEQGFGG
jgi:hypothetical protein